MTMRLYIEVAGDKEINARLTRLIDNLVETRSVMEEIAILLAESNKAGFGRGAPLSESTLEQKEAAGFPKTKLVRTGALRESVTTVEGGPHAIREIGNASMIFGTTAWYGIFAKTGTEKEPKRFVMGAGPKVRVSVREIVFRHLGWGV